MNARDMKHRAARAAWPLAAALLLGLGACAPAHIPQQTPPPIPAGGQNSIVSAARSLTGVRYHWGGDSPRTGFDCSGFTWWTYKQIGVNIPRVSSDQYATGQPVGRQDIRAGDLVFFRLGGNPKNMHVGIATGRDTFIHSPSSGGSVREDSMDLPYWRERFIGARRVVQTGG